MVPSPSNNFFIPPFLTLLQQSILCRSSFCPSYGSIHSHSKIFFFYWPVLLNFYPYFTDLPLLFPLLILTLIPPSPSTNHFPLPSYTIPNHGPSFSLFHHFLSYPSEVCCFVLIPRSQKSFSCRIFSHWLTPLYTTILLSFLVQAPTRLIPSFPAEAFTQHLLHLFLSHPFLVHPPPTG